MMRIILVVIGVALITLPIGLVYGLALGLPTMLLWNWLMPSMFGVKEINLLQAVGLLYLSGLFFHCSKVTTGFAGSVINQTFYALLPAKMQSELNKIASKKSEP
jgi:hypothetical protein